MMEEYEVRIFGATYLVKSDKGSEFVFEVASYLDSMMQEIASRTKEISSMKIAVISALNAVEKLFETEKHLEQANSERDNSAKSFEHFKELFDEAKKNYLLYRDENEALKNEVRNLETSVSELETLRQKNSDLEYAAGENERLKLEIDELKGTLKKSQSGSQLMIDVSGHGTAYEKNSESGDYAELEKKCKELENALFEVQAENVKLKNG